MFDKVPLSMLEQELANAEARAQAHAEQAIAEAVDRLKAAPQAWFDSIVRKRVIVHHKGSPSIDGLLVAVMADGVLLRGAKLLEDDGKQIALAGEVFVPRENIGFVQLVDPEP